MATKPKLSADLIESICARIKAGAFERVAVESLGVSWACYQGWMQFAADPHSGTVYKMLADAVMQARAQARFMAEMEIHEKDRKVWLLQGPGREANAEDGWGKPAKTPASADAAEARAPFWRLCEQLLIALAPFPEARAAAAEVIKRLDLESSTAPRE
jgi:hypothetical protein